MRQAFVLEGFEAALVCKKRATAPTPKLLDGAAEAKLIALRLGKPPAGRRCRGSNTEQAAIAPQMLMKIENDVKTT